MRGDARGGVPLGPRKGVRDLSHPFGAPQGRQRGLETRENFDAGVTVLSDDGGEVRLRERESRRRVERSREGEREIQTYEATQGDREI